MPAFMVTPAQALEMGWSIIPTNRNKVPMLSTWKAYQTRKPTTEEFDTWCQWNPPAWALVTGAISNRITFDFDGKEGCDTLKQLQIEPHRQTPSGGFHADFTHPGWRVTSVSGKTSLELGARWPGLDIRGDGGYALFFGQTDRGAYEWLRDNTPHSLDILPAPLREFLGVRTKSKPTTSDEMAEQLVEMAISRIPMQGRNSAGFWLAAQLRDAGFAKSTAEAVVNKYRNRCPTTNRKGEEEQYTESETRASLDQAYSRSPRDSWHTTNNAPPTNVQSSTQSTDEEPPEPPPSKTHFLLTSKGVFHVDEETGSKVFICSRLDVEAYARDTNSESWGRLIKWKDRNDRAHSWVVPMRMLVGDGLIFRETLADGGLEIGTAQKINQLLVNYIRTERPSRFIYCVPYVGWLNRAYVFPESAIPENADVGYQSLGRGEHFYKTSGTLESWQNEISRKCAGNSRLVLAVSAAFAGPLLRPLNVQGGGFHFHALSSIGKSTTLSVAGSVCGGGGRNGFARTWAATKNALESIAELHNDGTLILDEIRQIELKEVEPIVYMLANGAGKSRENRTLTGRRTLQWLLMILSSGEIPLSECAALANQKIRGGVDTRLVSIPADAGAGLGIFEKLHDTDEPHIFAETLEAAAKTHYGTAIRTFLERLIANWDENIEKVRTFTNQFIENIAPHGAAPEIGRVLRRFAITAAAGDLATELGVTGWDEQEATEAGAQCFDDWIKDRGSLEASDVENAIAQVRNIITREQARFRPAEPILDDQTKKPIPLHINKELGYWKRIENEVIYLVSKGNFQDELCHGFNHQQVARELHKRGFLLKNESDRLVRKEDVTTATGELLEDARFYCIRSKILRG